MPFQLSAQQRFEVDVGAEGYLGVSSAELEGLPLTETRGRGSLGGGRQGQPGSGWSRGLGHRGRACLLLGVCVGGALPPRETWRSCWDKKAQRASFVIIFSFYFLPSSSCFVLFSFIFCFFSISSGCTGFAGSVGSYCVIGSLPPGE